MFWRNHVIPLPQRHFLSPHLKVHYVQICICHIYIWKASWEQLQGLWHLVIVHSSFIIANFFSHTRTHKIIKLPCDGSRLKWIVCVSHVHSLLLIRSIKGSIYKSPRTKLFHNRTWVLAISVSEGRRKLSKCWRCAAHQWLMLRVRGAEHFHTVFSNHPCVHHYLPPIIPSQILSKSNSCPLIIWQRRPEFHSNSSVILVIKCVYLSVFYKMQMTTVSQQFREFTQHTGDLMQIVRNA